MARVDFNTKKLTSKVTHNAEAFIRKVVLDGMTSLIRQNPVDTGRSKAAWSTSVGSVGSETPEMAGGKTPHNAKSSPIDFSKSVEGISNYKLGQTMFLFNNMAYILALAYGSSKQAPKGWIRNTGILMQKKLNEVKNLI